MTDVTGAARPTRIILAVEDNAANLSLLDLHVPGISGEEVVASLRADAVTAGIAVVIVSADANAKQLARLLDRGAVDYLTKPIDIDRLLAVVDEHGLPTVADGP